VSHDGAVLSWITDEEACIEVDYMGDSLPEIKDNVYKKSHSVSLWYLEPEKTYNVTIRAIDSSGNVGEYRTSLTTLPKPDFIPPVISDMLLEVNETADIQSILIKYTTNELTQDSVEVINGGRTYSLFESQPKTSHSFTFSDPASDSVNIKLVAIDEAGNSTRKYTSAVVDAAVNHALIAKADLNDLHQRGIEDADTYGNFLEECNYQVTYIDNATYNQLVSTINETLEKTDGNDNIYFTIVAHSGGTRGENYKLKLADGFVDPKDILDNFSSGEYKKLVFIPISCSGKAVIDRISISNFIGIAATHYTILAQEFFYNTGHGAPIGIIPEVKANSNITTRELFNELYNDFTSFTPDVDDYVPFLCIKGDPAEPLGEYEAYSDKDGVIHGYSELLDRRAFRIPELKEE